jgi:hypothetical protein
MCIIPRGKIFGDLTMKKLFIFLVSFLCINVVFAQTFETLPENLTIKPIKSYSATVKSSSSKEVIGRLSLSDMNGQVNYVYADDKHQQKITFTLERHFGEVNAFLFQVFDENQTQIGKLAISNTSNMFFKGFELYGPDEDLNRILNRQANPIIIETGEIVSNNFKVYNNEKKILATLSGRAGLVEVNLHKDNLANENLVINNSEYIDLLLALFAMQSLESIQTKI